MRIGIVSDTHGDAAAWQGLAKGIFRGVGMVIHAGDILYRGPRRGWPGQEGPGALSDLINNGPYPVLIARGNCDSEEDQLMLDYPVMSPYLFLQAEGLRILVNHGQGLDRAELLAMAARYRVHLMVYGHTHRPLLAEEGGVVLLNPGSPALPKGGFPSAALLDGTALRLYDLSTNGVVGEAMVKIKNGR